jgi:drug/metabolite transporter (DMT)-like permease
LEGWQLALMAAVCWAAEALLVRMAGDRVDPLIGTAYSCVAAGIMFSAYLALTGRLGVGELNMSAAYYVLAGVISFAVGHYFYYTAITRSGVSLSVSLAASYPLLAMLASVILFKEPVTLRTAAGALLITLGGMVLLI